MQGLHGGRSRSSDGVVGRSTRVRRVPAIAVLLSVFLVARAAGAQAVPDTLASAARTVLPAVVTLTLPGEVGGPDLPAGETSRGDVLLGLFGDLLSEGRRRPVASGVILDPSGVLVTAAHAVAESADLEATTADGSRHRVAVVGVDRKTDVALLRLIGSGPFGHAVLGDSDEMRVGARVLAIGSPYGLGSTATGGIISATPRPKPTAAVEELFQTDAATFPDSAGGPLVNARGEVIGLISVLTAYDFGISFALPSNIVRKIVGRLARDGVVQRGTLDLRVQRLTPGLARALAAPEPIGLLVTEVSSQGSVARAGLLVGDVLTRLDSVSLAAPYDLERALRDSAPGQIVELAYWRKGRQRTARIALARDGHKPLVRPFSSRSAALLRFEVRPIAPELGVVIAHVRPDQPMVEPGVRAGDVIREVNQQPVRTVAEFERLIEAVRPGEWLALLVQRGRVPVIVAVEARDH